MLAEINHTDLNTHAYKTYGKNPYEQTQYALNQHREEINPEKNE
jgi:hypothetical protein